MLMYYNYMQHFLCGNACFMYEFIATCCIVSRLCIYAIATAAATKTKEKSLARSLSL